MDYGFFMDLKSIWIMDFYGFKIHIDYGFFMDFESIWVMDFLWNGFGFKSILTHWSDIRVYGYVV